MSAERPAGAATARPDPRTAARAAAEARLRALEASTSPSPASAMPPASSATEASASARPSWLEQTPSSASSVGTGLFAARSNSPAKPDAGWEASEKEDRETRRKFAKLLDRGIVRDNGYKEAAACVETLHTIASNVINSSDPKFRNLKASNNALKNKVLAVEGGKTYLIALGFRVRTVDFAEHLVYEPSLKKMHELKIGTEILQQHLSGLQERATAAADRQKYAAQEKAARVARALAEIDADRDSVKVRVERDKRMREREERIARETAEREAIAEQEREALLAEERARRAEESTPPPPYRNDRSATPQATRRSARDHLVEDSVDDVEEDDRTDDRRAHNEAEDDDTMEPRSTSPGRHIDN